MFKSNFTQRLINLVRRPKPYIVGFKIKVKGYTYLFDTVTVSARSNKEAQSIASNEIKVLITGSKKSRKRN